MRRYKQLSEPEVRAGHCCGCGSDDILYKVPNIFRYRCAKCFKAEVGGFHHLTPPSVVIAISAEVGAEAATR